MFEVANVTFHEVDMDQVLPPLLDAPSKCQSPDPNLDEKSILIFSYFGNMLDMYAETKMRGQVESARTDKVPGIGRLSVLSREFLLFGI